MLFLLLILDSYHRNASPWRKPQEKKAKIQINRERCPEIYLWMWKKLFELRSLIHTFEKCSPKKDSQWDYYALKKKGR